MNFPFLIAKERLIRIMGTFDLATGHADTWDELLDSLESELRDVLGHYREALAQQADHSEQHLDMVKAQPEQEPVATVESVATVVSESGNQEVTMSWWHEPALPVGTKLYTTPPQRTWVGLTDEDKKQIAKEANYNWEMTTGEYAERIGRLTEAKLKEKNT